MKKHTTTAKLGIDRVRAMLHEENGVDKLAKHAEPEAAVDAAIELFLGGDHLACAYLCRIAVKRRMRERINSAINRGAGRETLYRTLRSDEPKPRRNTAKLLGELGQSADILQLGQALERESTLYVIPSIILALGAFSETSELARGILTEYTPPVETDSAEARLYADIRTALNLAREKFTERKPHTLKAVADIGLRVELLHPENLGRGLENEIHKLTSAKVCGGNKAALTVLTAQYGALFAARCFHEALICLGEYDIGDDEELLALKSEFLEMLFGVFECNNAAFAYRMELRGRDIDRAKLADRIRRVWGEDGRIVNSVSQYEVELRLEISRSVAKAYLKPCAGVDTRFDYRVRDIPAAMNPATAAAVFGELREFIAAKPNSRVLDVCCGSGTFLFEREKAAPAAELLGLDISDRAIAAAKANCTAAGSAAQFIRTDCLKFIPHGGRFDEIIANLPFGNRVDTRAEAHAMYAELIRRLPHLLTPGGTAILYTAERTHMARVLEDGSINPRRVLSTESGGLKVGVFVV